MTTRSQKNGSKPDLVGLLILGVFMALQLWALHFHEPWADELQAWLLARDCSPWELLSVRLKYEATPGLWQLLLMIPAAVSTNPIWVNLISSVIACCTAAVLIFKSPFPRWLRYLLPFTYFFGYQYSIVARDYSLVALGTVLAAYFRRDRIEKPWPYTLSLVIMMLSSSHGLLAACGIAAWDLFPPTNKNFRSKAPLIRLAPVLIVCVGLVALQVFPRPADYAFGANPLKDAGYLAFLQGFSDATTGFLIPSCVVLALSLYVFYQRGYLGAFLLCYAPLALFFSLKYYALWHSGIVFLVWFFYIWQCWLEEKADEVNTTTHRLLGLVLISVVAIQLYQTTSTVAMDVADPYTGLQACVSYLKGKHLTPSDVAVTSFHGTAINAYFPESKPGFFTFNRELREKANRFDFPAKPYLLVTMIDKREAPYLMELDRRGYKVIADFPGIIIWKGQRLELQYYFLLTAPTKAP